MAARRQTDAGRQPQGTGPGPMTANALTSVGMESSPEPLTASPPVPCYTQTSAPQKSDRRWAWLVSFCRTGE